MSVSMPLNLAGSAGKVSLLPHVRALLCVSHTNMSKAPHMYGCVELNSGAMHLYSHILAYIFVSDVERMLVMSC